MIKSSLKKLGLLAILGVALYGMANVSIQGLTYVTDVHRPLGTLGGLVITPTRLIVWVVYSIGLMVGTVLVQPDESTGEGLPRLTPANLDRSVPFLYLGGADWPMGADEQTLEDTVQFLNGCEDPVDRTILVDSVQLNHKELVRFANQLRKHNCTLSVLTDNDPGDVQYDPIVPGPEPGSTNSNSPDNHKKTDN